uniref:Vesicle transport protein GOT1B n=1 Tax=Anopheles culicifacies TaxID=139723 RepID=A0A182MJX6_9DIPT
MFEITDTQKIGVGLAGFGITFLFLGTLLLFDKGLLAIGNHKMKASIAFFGGIAIVLLGYPLIGMLIEMYGFILLFSGFFPVAINFLRRVPVLGNILNMPGISRTIDWLAGESDRTTHECTASTTEHVREGTLEEGTTTFLLGDGCPAVKRALVHDLGLGATRLHHHATTDGVEGIGHDTGNGGHDLSDGPAHVEWCSLRVRQHTAGSIVKAEVGSTVDDDTCEKGRNACMVMHMPPYRATPSPNCRHLPGTGEVERVDEAQRGSAGHTTGGQVTDEVAHELGVLVHTTQEHLLVLVLEGEVEGLRREVTDDVGEITAPEGTEALLARDTHEAIDHALVAVGLCDLLRDVLNL